jgi:hypothetical protein
MSELINIDNYESFYLDFLEGNLNENDIALLFAFLDSNPDLKIEDSELISINAHDSIQLDDLTKSLLKFPGLDEVITTNNIEYFLIAAVENQLSDDKQGELQEFLAINTAFLVDLEYYKKSYLNADTAIIFNEKNKLKKGIIIPMYARFLAAAAGIALLFSLLNLNSSESTPNVAIIKKKDEKTLPKTKLIAPSTSIQIARVGDQEAVDLIENGKQKLNENSSKESALSKTENIQALEFKSIEKLNSQSLMNDVAVTYIKPFSQPKLEENNESTFALVEMKNPIKPITNRIGEAINQQVDFKTSKAAKKKPGGFLLKVGKFEISRKVYDNSSIALK